MSGKIALILMCAVWFLPQLWMMWLLLKPEPEIDTERKEKEARR